jgi:hypothetical protein
MVPKQMNIDWEMKMTKSPSDFAREIVSVQPLSENIMTDIIQLLRDNQGKSIIITRKNHDNS